MSDDPGFRLLLTGPWPPGRVLVRVVDSTFRPSDRANQAAWHDGKRRLGDRLFDGPMCRFEAARDAAGTLNLDVSRTGYRQVVITNLHGPRDLPPQSRANPVGVSAALETADGTLLFGRRGDNVAYYPGRAHPFAGSLEWPAAGRDIDVFAEMRRELLEELSLDSAEIVEKAVAAVAEDVDLQHPELLLRVRTTATAADLRTRIDVAEHDAAVAVDLTVPALSDALKNPSFTPIARAALTLARRAIRDSSQSPESSRRGTGVSPV